MNHQVEKYLSDLIGHPVTKDSPIQLTSGQKARFASWCESNQINLNRSVLKKSRFSLEHVVGFASDSTTISTTVAVQAESPASPTLSDLKIGIDIQSVDEIVPDANNLKDQDELQSIFTVREISYAETRMSPRETLAGIFAAKESIRKTGPDMAKRALANLEILPDENGAPQFAGFAISISHSGGFAIAAAIPNASPQLSGMSAHTSSDSDRHTHTTTPEGNNDKPASRKPKTFGRKKVAALLALSMVVGAVLAAAVILALLS